METEWNISGTCGTSGMTEQQNPVNRIVLDTNAVIFLAAKGNLIPDALREYLQEADLFVSVITEIELFAKPNLPFGEAEKLRSVLSDEISVVELTGAVKKETIALRQDTKIKLPDCIVAATAIILNVVLLTDDTQLLRLNWSGYSAKKIR